MHSQKSDLITPKSADSNDDDSNIMTTAQLAKSMCDAFEKAFNIDGVSLVNATRHGSQHKESQEAVPTMPSDSVSMNDTRVYNNSSNNRYSDVTRTRQFGDGWLMCVNELTEVIRRIIEFAKSVEAFRRLSQTDQILLLIGCMFELVMITLAPHYNAEVNAIMKMEGSDGQMMPLPLHYSGGGHDSIVEAAFNAELRTCLRWLSSFQLSTTETALLSAYVLLKDAEGEQHFVDQLKYCLADRRAKGLFAILPRLKDVSYLHSICFDRFRERDNNSFVRLPPLYAEVFTRNEAKAQASMFLSPISCKVCGDQENTGVHYGVITCEGCGDFFRHSTNGSIVSYRCPKVGRCVINQVTRNQCNHCRLKRCLELGMDAKNEKFGAMPKEGKNMEAEGVGTKYHSPPPPSPSTYDAIIAERKHTWTSETSGEDSDCSHQLKQLKNVSLNSMPQAPLPQPQIVVVEVGRDNRGGLYALLTIFALFAIAIFWELIIAVNNRPNL